MKEKKNKAFKENNTSSDIGVENESSLIDDESDSLNNNGNSNKKPNSKKTILSSVLSGVIVALTCAFVFFAGFFTHYFTIDKDLRSINFVLTNYKKYYYDQKDQDVMDTLMEGLADEYSRYFSKDEYVEYMRSSDGIHAGFGFSITKENEIVRVVGNSPVENAGIKRGDKIIGYKNNKEGEYISASDAEKLVKYANEIKKGEKIYLKIKRNDEILEFEVEKNNYQENYVYYSDNTSSYHFKTDENNEMQFVKYSEKQHEINQGWGYIKLTSFDGSDKELNGAYGQFKRALKQFKDENNHKLIIDLRDNGGGYLRILEKLASFLCVDDEHPQEKMLCQVAVFGDNSEGKSYAPKSVYNDYNFEKIVFLANSGSASASEALMGVTLDYDKKSNKNIVNVVLEPTEKEGETIYKTYGKGIMQSFFENKLTGEAVKLTTAKIYWPISRISIHGVGLTPSLDERILPTVGDPILYAQTL